MIIIMKIMNKMKIIMCIMKIMIMNNKMNNEIMKMINK